MTNLVTKLVIAWTETTLGFVCRLIDERFLKVQGMQHFILHVALQNYTFSCDGNTKTLHATKTLMENLLIIPFLINLKEILK